MKFTTITIFNVYLLLISFITAFAAPVDFGLRDVYVPQVLYPRRGVVWTVGERHHVTWDTSNPPAQITNKVGRIMLRKGDFTTSLVLADNFDILLGKIEVTVPRVQNGDDYQVVLFGDSGNFSPRFTIKNY